MTRMRLAGLVVACVVVRVHAGFAQPTCSGNEQLMSWPDGNPVWQFCWLRAADSSGSSGSGLEIRRVYYNGHEVMKQAHVPILNVQYDPNGCGGPNHCYRDWMFEEKGYLANNLRRPGYAEPASPCPQSVCETGGSLGDCPPLTPPDTCDDAICFLGVSAQKFADRLEMMTQTQAGWYRYTMRWTFYLDGRIEPRFGFSAVNDACISFTHRHHAYWRFDFDIDGPANDLVTEGPNPALSGGRSGPRYPTVSLPTEAIRRANKPAIVWSVADAATHRGYRIVPGGEQELPADAFSVADVWLLRYKSNEIDDNGQSGPDCAIKMSDFVNGEGLSSDLVVWYRTGALHVGGDLDDCHVVGPTLVPFGDWSP
jgi:hypothetical protein